jgi:hypothetical protein
MSYRLNNFVPVYLEYTDYNLKNVYIEGRRKVYGRQIYKIYNKRLVEGIYKFGFYKDIINGELAVIDSGIKRIQIVKDEISGKDSDINLSWVFATKHLENHNDAFGYEYKNIYNLKLLCSALLRFENRNKNMRKKIKAFNLKPSFRLGLNKKGINLSFLVLRKKNLMKSLLVKFLRFWHGGKIKASSAKFFSFFVSKIRLRLKKLVFLFIYYKLRYLKIFEFLFLPAKVFLKNTNLNLLRTVKRPPLWMLKRFGVSTRKKLVRGLFWKNYVNYAGGLWNLSETASLRRLNALDKKKELWKFNLDKRKDILSRSYLSLSFLNFFNSFYRNRKFHVRQKHKYSICFMLASDFMFNKLLLHKGKKHMFYIRLFSDFMHITLNGVSFLNKKPIYEIFLFFVCINLQFSKSLGVLFRFFASFEICFYLQSLPNRLIEAFLYKERFFLYNIGLKYSFEVSNAYCVPLLKKYFGKRSKKIMRKVKHYLRKCSTAAWRWNKKYSWRWRKRALFKRIRRRRKGLKFYFSWMDKYLSARLVKRRFGTRYKLVFKNKIKKRKNERRKSKEKITKTGKPYKKHGEKPVKQKTSGISKDQGTGIKRPWKDFNKREIILGSNIQKINKKPDATIR